MSHLQCQDSQADVQHRSVPSTRSKSGRQSHQTIPGWYTSHVFPPITVQPRWPTVDGTGGNNRIWRIQRSSAKRYLALHTKTAQPVSEFPECSGIPHHIGPSSWFSRFSAALCTTPTVGNPPWSRVGVHWNSNFGPTWSLSSPCPIGWSSQSPHDPPS